MEAIVLAGGFGTRLKHVVPDVPKPMAPVAGRPFLEYVLCDLAEKDVTRAVLAVGHKREIIMDHFGDTFHGMEIAYSQEDSPLFTGGAIKRALGHCRRENVFVLNGDTFFDVPLKEMAGDHARSGARLSLAVKEMRDFDRYGTVHFTPEGWIDGFEEKKPQRHGYISGGVYLMDARLLDGFPEAFSFEKQVLEACFELVRMRAFVSGGYFIDIGVPEDYYAAQRALPEALGSRSKPQ